jgi:hypothetical protein
MFDADGQPVGSPLVHLTDFVTPADPWLESVRGRFLFDEKTGWSLVVTVQARKGLGKFVEKVTGKVTGIADAVAPRPEITELIAEGSDPEGRQVYRSPVLFFEKDPRTGIYKVSLEFAVAHPGGRGESKVRYGQCWVFAS